MVVSSLLAWGSRPAKALPKLFTLSDVSRAIGEAAESFTKLIDSFEHLIETGTKGYDKASARFTHRRLVRLSVRISILLGKQQQHFVDPIDIYIEHPTRDNWESIQGNLETIFEEINGILADVNEERSDFVLETTFFDMLDTLGHRSIIVGKLIDMPPPVTEEELYQLRSIQRRYQTLIARLKRATLELNNYLIMVDSTND